MRIDRGELLSKCASLILDGGLLIAVGDNASGRNEAARLAASFFEESGLNTRHVLDAGTRPNSLRYILENIASWATSELGVAGPGLSIAASNASVSLETMSGYCIQALQRLRRESRSDLAFIISALGQTSPVDRHEVELLGQTDRKRRRMLGCSYTG